jgi:hypothetical protein
VWLHDYVAPLMHAIQLAGADTASVDRMLIVFHHKITT